MPHSFMPFHGEIVLEVKRTLELRIFAMRMKSEARWERSPVHAINMSAHCSVKWAYVAMRGQLEWDNGCVPSIRKMFMAG